jgi:indole-3-glycerol phosphate synthase
MRATLAEIVSHKKTEIAKSKELAAIEGKNEQVCTADGRFKGALAGEAVNLICEIKPKSPSAGVLKEGLQVDTLVKSFSKYASAISVLTDERFFGGSFDLLHEVRKITQLPILCKDFILDPYQCLEARRAGADAVLLIAKILESNQLSRLYSQITDLGMVPVVEIQNEAELEKAKSVNAAVILINNRNLDDFAIDLTTTLRLAPKLPGGSVGISASGIESRSDIDSLLGVCCNFLIGTVLMKATDIETKLRELRGDPQQSIENTKAHSASQGKEP